MPEGAVEPVNSEIFPTKRVLVAQNGKQVDTMLDTYLKCAARTEWVSPISIDLVDSVETLEKEWNSGHFKTVWLRDRGTGLKGMEDIMDRMVTVT